MRFDVIIVGAGIAGISTAYYLVTRQNLSNILILDKRPPLTHTSDKSGSNYRNWWAHPAMRALADHSIDLMDGLSRRTQNIFNLNRRGYVYFRRDADPDDWLSPFDDADIGEIRVHRNHGRNYYPGENWSRSGADILLGNSLIRQIAPFVSDDIRMMVHVRRAGWLSTSVLAHLMLDTAIEAGTTVMKGEFTGVERADDGYEVSVVTAAGPAIIRTAKVLLAMGPEMLNFREMLDTSLPLENFYQRKLILRDEGSILPEGMPFMIITDAPRVHWTESELAHFRENGVQDEIPGNLHIRRVNPAWVHMGWAFNRQNGAAETTEPDSHFAKLVVKGMSSFVPAMRPYVGNIPQPAIVSGGFYTRATDNLPIVDQTAAGIYLIGALSGFGIMMGCALGEIMSDMIVEADLPKYLRHFSAKRYRDAQYVQKVATMNTGIL